MENMVSKKGDNRVSEALGTAENQQRKFHSKGNILQLY